MDIRNKTPRPIKVPLPTGQVLRLGPRMTGQITAKAATFEGIQKLIDDGTIEIVGDGGTKGVGGTVHDGGGGAQKSGPSGGGTRHQGGDR